MRRLSVIIIEENEDVICGISENFKKYEDVEIVGICKSGESGIEEIARIRPDVAIVNLVMPNTDGFSILDFVREKNIDCEIIIISSISGDKIIKRAMDSGAKYFMAKPLNYDALHNRIVSFSDNVPLVNFLERKIPQKNKSLDEKISNIFMIIGIPAHIKGYQFLREAIKLCIESPDYINSITRLLYPMIANRFETTPSKVERAIRHAIEVAWNRGRIENINNLFGVKVYSSNDKPTNGEFVALIADKLLIEGA